MNEFMEISAFELNNSGNDPDIMPACKYCLHGADCDIYNDNDADCLFFVYDKA